MKTGDSKRISERTIAGAIAAILGCYTAQCVAQEWALEEVIVTAQKKTENLQDVPISVVALDAAALEREQIASVMDLRDGKIPAVHFAQFPGSSEVAEVNMRGTTINSAFITQPSPFAVHLDGVYLSQLFGLSNPAAELERMEVLKGPQGVLSGRNASAGAINVYTVKPTLGKFTFKQQLSAAERKQYEARTVVNVPLGETLAMRFSYLWTTRGNEGIRNSAPGGVQFGKREANAGRVGLRWVPNDAVTVDYGFDYSIIKSYDTPPQCLYPAAALTSLLPVGDARIAEFIDGCGPERKKALYWPYQWSKNRNELKGHTLNIEWQVTDKLLLRSITGYRFVNARNQYNYGAYSTGASVRADSGPYSVPGTPFTGQSHPTDLHNKSVSQEFNLLGDLNRSLKYTAGVFVSSEDGSQLSGPNVGMYLPSGAGFPGVDFVMLDHKGIYSSKLDSWAVFGQLTWKPSLLEEKLEVVPGVRYTRDHRSVVGYNDGWTTGYVVVPTGVDSGMLLAEVPIAAPDVGFASAGGSRSYSKVTPALSLNYHWTPDIMTYAKYSVGFTSGGFDPVSGPARRADFVRGYDPETAKSIELGLKSEFWDRRLRMNLALFQNKFTNEQRTVAQATGGWMIENIGGSTYRGLELEASAALTEGLRVDLTFATLHHRYDKWVDRLTGIDVTNQRKLIVPKNDYSIGLDYRFPDFGLPGQLAINVDYAHRDRVSTPLNLSIPNVDLYSTTPAFSLLNARLELANMRLGASDRNGLTLAVWGRNLTDKEYLTFANQGWTTAGSGSWGTPRTIGVDLRYEFN